MRFVGIATVAVLLVALYSLPVCAQNTLENQHLKLTFDPVRGGAVTDIALKTLAGNHAGPGGLIQEGFGVPNPYVPNRRLNEKLTADEKGSTVTYSYDCDGPNIVGLHVTRTMQLVPGESAIQVKWRVENNGKESQWVTPWVRNEVALGGSVTEEDRLDAPTLSGVSRMSRSRFVPASRNWIAVTDPTASVTVFGAFNADQTHSFLGLYELVNPLSGFQTMFLPHIMSPGGVWETSYRIGVVRGLKHVDFASKELAAQIDYAPGKLEVLLASVKTLSGVYIYPVVVAANGRRWKLDAKKFDIDPSRVVRCTFNWTAPGDGPYDFMAELKTGGKQLLPLNEDLAAPHGGIDTQFVVGKLKTPLLMESWTDAPHALDRGARKFKRAVAGSGPIRVWIENGLEKVFRNDEISPEETTSGAAISLWAARNEYESFQLVVRPSKGEDLVDVTATVSDLKARDSVAIIPAGNVSVSTVSYYPVRIPSHFEGPTGFFPDVLTPLKPFKAKGDQNSPLWFTLYVPADAAPGAYSGEVVVGAFDLEPIHIPVQLEVFDFELPRTPSLKTDFGFWLDSAVAQCKRQGCGLSPEELLRAYANNALDHRVTLRRCSQLPDASAETFAKELDRRAKDIQSYVKRGATTVAVPPSLLDAPDALAKAVSFLRAAGLEDRAFCPMAVQPAPAEWPVLVERFNAWKTGASDISLMVSTSGLQPFLPNGVDIWSVHSQMFETPNSKVILEHGQQGGKNQIWWFVDHYPSRPYANLFIDYAGIEHRILFWQAWILGVRGFQYWNANYAIEEQDPLTNQLDLTPTNGDGFLIYPGPDGPRNSIRWEIIRDGIEDYDYLAILAERLKRAKSAGAGPEVISKGEKATNLGQVVPDLMGFSRDSGLLMAKRREIAEAVMSLGRY